VRLKISEEGEPESDTHFKQPKAYKKSSDEKGSKESAPELFKQLSAVDMSFEKETPLDQSADKNIMQSENKILTVEKIDEKAREDHEIMIQDMDVCSEKKSDVSHKYEKKINLDKLEILQKDNSDENNSEHNVPVGNQNLVSGSYESGQKVNNKSNEILDEKPPEEWYKFSEEVKKSSSKLASIVRNAVPQSLDGPYLKLVFKSGNYSTIMTQENKNILEKIASKFSGHSVKLTFEDSKLLTTQKSIAEYDQLLIEKEKADKRKKAKEFPLVKDILTIFKNSKITSIELSDA